MRFHYVKKVNSRVLCPHKLQQLGRAGVEAAITSPNKYWKEDITYHFIGGTEVQREKVREGLAVIKNVTPGLKIKEVSTGGQIRISHVEGNGSWSYIGSDALLIKQELATMNFGWEEPTYRTVLHEFLHAFGFQHEHIHPDIKYNWDLLLTDFAEVNGWTEEQVRYNFTLHEGSVVHNYDSDSVMHYYIECKYVLEGPCGKYNTELSAGDIEQLNIIFPDNTVIIPVEPTEGDCKALLKTFLAKLFPSKSRLSKLLESQVVTIANELDIDATTKDLKKDTVDKVINELNK